MRTSLTIGSLFSGIGGLDLGLEWAGLGTPIWFCECEPYCQKVLAKHWPGIPCYGDVREIDETTPRPDLITGGFPCQPFSVAGKRKGASDRRNLWPEFRRVLGLLRPRYALLENVPGLVASGYTGEILADLASFGYDAEWGIVGAWEVGAPHKRDRWFCFATLSDTKGQSRQVRKAEGKRQGRPSSGGDVAYPKGNRQSRSGATWPGRDGPKNSGEMANASKLERPAGTKEQKPIREVSEDQPKRDNTDRPSALADPDSSRGVGRTTQGQATQARCDSPASRPGWWAVEPDVGRVAYGVPRRVDRLRALGNAVVPQVAQKIGEKVSQYIGM